MIIDISSLGKDTGTGEFILEFYYESLGHSPRLLLMLSILIHIYLSQKLLSMIIVINANNITVPRLSPRKVVYKYYN